MAFQIEDLFALDSPYMPKHVGVSNLVLTFGMRKMLVLTYQVGFFVEIFDFSKKIFKIF